MNERPKASDLDTLEVLRFIERMSHTDWPIVGGEPGPEGRWVMEWDFDEALAQGEFGGVPYKVVRAKLGKLIKQGLVTGCTCGCRGDFELTECGRLYAIEGATPSASGG